MAYGPRTLASLCRPSVKRDILARYVYRFTMEHVPSWARKPCQNGKFYAPQFVSDDEWLSNTIVHTRKDGELNDRYSDCETSGQTWPLGRWLDEPYRKA